ncbi:beta-glucosidase family protein [Nocardioides rubriscoriae]|uniref:beta-glucosidase family protein n=1 Tax=Nocardioides rubriscoriae TaxID=642762 RepID=UPI001478C1CD|nr:glycoside hydrolase family 3 C-terminal domain-containing protein [Nocardioides rubriscoriae]
MTVGLLAAVLAAGLGVDPGQSAAQPTVARATTQPCPTQQSHPWCDRSLGPDRRAVLFQQAMTLEEEIRLLGGQGMGAAPHTGGTYAVPRLGLREVYLTDGPVGVRQGRATLMPIPMALAATFSPRHARRYGAVVGDEAKHKGNDVVYAPTVNLMRTPQNGRTFEGYGEDTFLVARTGVEWIRGAQAQGVIANVKHYAANNQEGFGGVPPLTSVEGGRMLVDVNIGYRPLYETYLPQFEAAVKQGHVGTIMCSYNRINGSYACQNSLTLQKILRTKWGFRGFTIADYGASKTTVNDLNRGLDFVPFQGVADQSYSPELISAAVASGLVTRATIDDHVRKILRTFFLHGVFDRPAYADDPSRIDKPTHRRVARDVEARAITLLKNDGVLPLRKDVRSIAVIGPYADRVPVGGGSGSVRAERTVTVLDALRRRAGRGVTVTYADGSDPAAAARLARAADVAVVVTGDVQTEGQDKGCLSLSCPTTDVVNSNGVLFLQGSSCLQQTCPLNGTDQDGLVATVAAANRRTVVVLETGGPVLTPFRGRVAALVEAWYPGQEGGTAIARMLYGDTDPGGRLPATFPASAGQVPTAGDRRLYPGVAEEVFYDEGIRVGYKWYDARGHRPAYPFGHGLSYTSFRYGPLTIRRAPGHNRVAVATMTVTNTGRRAGVAVPQLYVSKPRTARVDQVRRQLVGYASVDVPRGRTVRVSFPLDERSFASWVGDRAGFRVVRGCYRFAAGSSSRSLPSSATVGRGRSCGAGSLRLSGRTGDVRLPLPGVAITTTLPR